MLYKGGLCVQVKGTYNRWIGKSIPSKCLSQWGKGGVARKIGMKRRLRPPTIWKTHGQIPYGLSLCSYINLQDSSVSFLDISLWQGEFFHTNSWWRSWWGRQAPCSLQRFMVEQRSACSPCKIAHQRRWMPKRVCDPEAHAEADSWQDLWPMRDPCWNSLFLKDCTVWKGPTLQSLTALCGKDSCKSSCRNYCLLWDGPHTRAGEECEGSFIRGGRSGRKNVWCTDCNPHSPSPTAARENKAEKSEIKSSLGERVEEKIFYFSLPDSDLIGKKLN